MLQHHRRNKAHRKRLKDINDFGTRSDRTPYPWVGTYVTPWVGDYLVIYPLGCQTLLTPPAINYHSEDDDDYDLGDGQHRRRSDSDSDGY